MNKSIMKTRNELERITHKINQLKNKYSCENSEVLSVDLYSRPLSNPCNKPQPEESESMQLSANSFEDIYRKQFRVFRNQLYEHIDHQLARAKGRENQFEEQIQEISQQLFERGDSSDLQIKVSSIQEELTRLAAISQDIAFQNKRQEVEHQKRYKKLKDYIGEVESVQEETLRSSLETFMNRMHLKFRKDDIATENARNQEMNDLHEKIEDIRGGQANEKQQNLSKMQREFDKLRKEMNNLKGNHEQGVEGLAEVCRQIQISQNQLIKDIEQAQSQIKKREEAISCEKSIINASFEIQIEESQTFVIKSMNQLFKAELESISEQTQEKYSVLEQQIKFTRQSLLEDIDHKFNQNDVNLAAIVKEITQFKGCSLEKETQQENPEPSKKQDKEILKFNREICNQIENINNIVLKLNDKTQSYEQKLKVSNNQLAEKIQFIDKSIFELQNNSNTFEQTITKFFCSFSDLSEAKTSEISRISVEFNQNLKDLERVNSEKTEQIGAKVLQLELVLEELKQERHSLKQEYARKSVDSIFSEEILANKSDIQLRNNQIALEKVISEKIQTVKAEILQLISQEATSTDEKLRSLNQNILQSAEQFKEYLTESEECYGTIQETIKMLSDSMREITQNQEMADLSHSKAFQGLQENCYEMIEQLRQELTADRSFEIGDSKQFKEVESKLIVLSENMIEMKSLVNSHIQNDAHPEGKLTVPLREDLIGDSESVVLETVSNTEVLKEELTQSIRAQLVSLIEIKLTKVSELLGEEMRRLEETIKKTATPKRRLDTSPNSEIDISFCSKQADNPVNQLIERCTSLEDEIGFLKRTFIEGHASKVDSLQRKVKKDLQEFKKNQQQQQDNLKNIISHEVFSRMAEQFTKISEILYKTFEELEEKHTKLEYHMNYFNSKIQELENWRSHTQMGLSNVKQSIVDSNVSGEPIQKKAYPSPSNMLSTLSANRFDFASRVSELVNQEEN